MKTECKRFIGLYIDKKSGQETGLDGGKAVAFLLKLKYSIARIVWRVTRPTTAGARAILVKDNKVLLVKHTYQADWYLPGGGLKKGETFEEAIRRELEEELEIRLMNLKLFGVYNNFYEYKSDTVVIFISDDFVLGSSKDNEIETFDFFQMDSLPNNVSPGTRRRITEYVNNQFNSFGRW